MRSSIASATWLAVAWLATASPSGLGEDLPKAFIDGTGPGWRNRRQTDFMRANCGLDTWTWKASDVHCSGLPVGVLRSKEVFTNFEMVDQLDCVQSLAVKVEEKKPWTVPLGIGLHYRIRTTFRIHEGYTKISFRNDSSQDLHFRHFGDFDHFTGRVSSPSASQRKIIEHLGWQIKVL